MSTSTDRTTRLVDAVTAWLDNEGGLLEQARERTIADGLFRPHDVDHMIGQIRQTVTGKALTEWIERVSEEGGLHGSTGTSTGVDSKEEAGSENDVFSKKGFPGQKTLCLHAGNLPIVGLQDVIATFLSGGVYYGKLSRSDRWLPDTLLRTIQKRLPEQTGHWSTKMEDLEGLKADNILFAGSQASVEAVIRRIRELDLAAGKARFLPRTARLSMAWLTEKDFTADLYPQLVEAMLRYEGKGCRSVAVVISAGELTACAGPLTAAAEAWLRDNPPESEEKPDVSYWKNYLKAVNKEVYELGGHIITSEPGLMGKEGVICWLKGDKEEVARLAGQFGSQLQSVYVTQRTLSDVSSGARTLHLSNRARTLQLSGGQPDAGNRRADDQSAENQAAGNRHAGNPDADKRRADDHDAGKRKADNQSAENQAAGNRHLGSSGIRLELLSQAQSPPIDWEPDGIDVLGWLLSK